MVVVLRSVMFRGQIERPFKAVHILTYSDKRVTVALNPQCLHILDSKSPPVSSHPQPHVIHNMLPLWRYGLHIGYYVPFLSLSSHNQ